MRTLVSLTDIESLKKELAVLLPDVNASHRAEGMARGLGWNTNAALRADLAEGPSQRRVGEWQFKEYLSDHGFPDVEWGVFSEAVVRVLLANEREAVRAIMKREPHLSQAGYPYIDPRHSPAEREAQWAEWRAAMLTADAIGQFVRAKEFLEQAVRTEKPVRRISSYGYKHQAERFQKELKAPHHYVANGMFIAAALDLGFQIRRIPGSPNVYLNIADVRPKRERKFASSWSAGPMRQAAWRNIMVAAINAGIDQGHFGLEPDDNRFQDGELVYRFSLDGLPGIAYVSDIGYGELAIHSAVNPTRNAEQTIKLANAGFWAGDGFSMGWMEREEGKYLQTRMPFASFRRPIERRLAELDLEPRGYAKNGPIR
jgi:hypothetical protein